MRGKKTSKVPETSTTLLRDVADSQHARRGVFHSRYEPMMQVSMRDRTTFVSRMMNYDAAYNEVRFGGFETPLSLRNRQNEERLEQLRRATQTFFKNLRSPRHFFDPRWKYAVEDMEDSIYEKYGIDQNRVPTDAEVELVAYCFDVDREEAISILRTRDLKTSACHASGAHDAHIRGAEG